MTIVQYLLLYLATIPVFFAIDMVWLAYVARGFYQTHLGYLLGPVQWIPALIFYAIYIAGILLFAVSPALKSGSWVQALILGAFLGFLCYATYDLTNLATVKDWPLIVTIADLIWGAVLTGSVALASYHIAVRFILP